MNHLSSIAHPLSRLAMLAVCLLISLLPALGIAAPGTPARHGLALAADSDGDGIADDFDPDDDNDGVADDQEGSAGNPGPDILDPGKDSDDDGISNVLDPDDNNNGVTDEEDPTSFPPSGGGGSSPNPPASQGPPTAPRQPATGSGVPEEPGFVVRSLPVTGAGPAASPWLTPALVASLLGLLGAACARAAGPAPGRPADEWGRSNGS